MTRRGKPKKGKVSSALLVPIVGDGALAGPVMQGRLIPVLILDTTRRPEVAEMIRVHGLVRSNGDVESQWVSDRDDPDVVALHLSFIRPVALDMYVPFSIEHQAILVEAVLRSEAVYLQFGEPGETPSVKMNDPKMLVEVPESGFRPFWDQILLDRMTAVMARDTGLSRRKARPLAMQVIEELSIVTGMRFVPPGG